jgi:hypothetical protein
MRGSFLALGLALAGGSSLLTTSCMGSEEEEANQAHAAAKATWCIVLKVDGADVRIALSEMNILLFKDDDYAKQHAAPFEIKGEGLHLIGEIPPDASPGYEEKIENLVGKTLPIKASGDFHHEGTIESKITLPGKPEIGIVGGSLLGERRTGKWSGSVNGDKTLHGKVKLTLRDGRSLEGTFSVHAITWG